MSTKEYYRSLFTKQELKDLDWIIEKFNARVNQIKTLEELEDDQRRNKKAR